MIINRETKLSEIKEKFQDQYPGLKIEFYTQEHHDHAGSPKSKQIEEDMQVCEVNTSMSSGYIDITENRSVAKVESDFETQFGLHAQIFRRSKELWLQTISTDDWSLSKQNLKGIHSTQNM